MGKRAPQCLKDAIGKEVRFGEVKLSHFFLTDCSAFSNCFSLFVNNSCSRRFFVIARAR